jgi:uncharacterized protein (DUF58 family)
MTVRDTAPPAARRESALARLMRRQGIDAAPFELNQRRLFILPTRHGWVFAALLGGLLIASANYGISLGYLFTFLLLGLAVVTLFHSHSNLAGLRIEPRPARPVFAGEHAVFSLELMNPSPLERRALYLEAGTATALGDCPGGARAELSLSLAAPKRGLLRVGRLTLSSTWPLGLFRCWTVCEFDWSVVVYPAPALHRRPLPKPSGAGRMRATENPGDDNFAGLRGYHPGDSPRHIAWKAVARGLSLQTKQFSGDPAGTLWLDWRQCREQDVEARLARLTRWALDAEKTGGDWGLRLPRRDLPPGHGAAHLHACLEALALYEA